MSWRTLLIQNKIKLSVKNKQLLCETDIGKQSIPAEDIAVVILDTPQVSLSSHTMSFFSSCGIVLLLCDDKHMPVGMLLPFQPHSRQTACVKKQIEWSVPFKKRAWQSIIKAKIGGQAQCLNAIGQDGADVLSSMTNKVNSGDPQNIEAQAARWYWKYLFGSEFKRLGWRDLDTDRVNAALNYGYAILRSAVSRSLVAHGFIPSLGLHHDNQLNAYNLSDDLVEVLRPLIDFKVFKLSLGWESEDVGFSPQDRQCLAGVGESRVLVGNENHELFWAIDLMTQSLARASKDGNSKLLSIPRISFDMDAG